LTDVTLALIETGANQRYLFGTNKLAHAVGASHLTREATTTWVMEAADDIGITSASRVEVDGAEIMLASSGKAMVLVPTPEGARDLVFAVTARAMVDAPGLRLHGAVSDQFEWGQGNLPGAIRCAHERSRPARAAAEINDLRFGRLPVVADCRYSAMPAAVEISEGGSTVAVSHEVAAKYAARDTGYTRLRSLVDPDGDQDLPTNLGDLEDKLAAAEKWVGVIHADGNGLGEVFTSFDHFLDKALDHPATDREHVDALRSLSSLLDRITERALAKACASTWPDGKIMVLPLVVGGDDLTMVCEGRVAHRFAASFAEKFVEISASELGEHINAVSARILGAALANAAVGMSVGVAITKPHFPFSTGHDLAVELLASAKETKRQLHDAHGQVIPSASLDVHVLFDSTATDLASIRTVPPSGLASWAGPFVVHMTAPPSDTTWFDQHRWIDLCDAVDLLTSVDDDRRVVPSSQTHALRTALLRSTAEAANRLAVLEQRAGTALTTAGLGSIEVQTGCGFTRWIDAMTLADLELT